METFEYGFSRFKIEDFILFLYNRTYLIFFHYYKVVDFKEAGFLKI